MESQASFLAWLHNVGYTFVGDARIGKLTPDEVAVLQLGHTVRQEQERQQTENARRGRKYSSPRRSTDEALAEWNERKRN